MRRKRWGWGFTQGLGGAGGSPYLIYNGTTTTVDCGSGASLDDLADAAFTAEAWIKSVDGTGTIFDKGSRNADGWRLYGGGVTTIYALLYAGGSVLCTGTIPAVNNTFNHLAITYDDAGDRKIRMWYGGLLVGTSTAASSPIDSDASRNLIIGSLDNATSVFDGAIGWGRISNNIRYSATFTPPPRSAYPAIDANTVAQWKADEGSGTTLNDSSGNANHGTITDGVWSRG